MCPREQARRFGAAERLEDVERELAATERRVDLDVPDGHAVLQHEQAVRATDQVPAGGQRADAHEREPVAVIGQGHVARVAVGECIEIPRAGDHRFPREIDERAPFGLGHEPRRTWCARDLPPQVGPLPTGRWCTSNRPIG